MAAPRLFKKKSPLAKKPIDKAQNKRLSKVERKLNLREIKHLPQANTAVAMSTVGSLNLHVNPVGQGTTEISRDGLTIQAHSLVVRYDMRVDEACSIAQFCRVVFVQDLQQQNGTSPAWLTVFTSASYLSQVSALTDKRFKILYDKTHVMDRMQNSVGTAQYGGRAGAYGQFTKKLVGPCKFTGNAGTTIAKNGIYMFSICNDAIDPPLIDYNVNYRFTDP